MHRGRFSDSDDSDGRDTNLDLQFSELGGGYDMPAAEAPTISANTHYDTAVSFSDDDDDDDDDSPPPRYSQQTRPSGAGRSERSENPVRPIGGYAPPSSPPSDDPAPPGMASLFALISRFEPRQSEVSVHWKPFIPDLAPAIGEIDAFIKVPRPDGELDDLGLVVVDEPSIAQSNPQVLRMELREEFGVSSPANEGDGYIGNIEDPQKNRKALDSWLSSIEDIHRKRPPPVMMYSHKMPEMEELMEPFSASFEETLNSLLLPSCEIDLSFEDYARVLCSVLDIPVRGNLVESLHHLFTLYCSFSGNTYFQSLLPGSPK